MPITGIDLGTSNPAAAVLRGGRPIIIAEGITLGGKAFPSFVALTAEGQMLVGEPARRQVTINPEGTATAFKRSMGRREKYACATANFLPRSCPDFCCKRSSGTPKPSCAHL
jgi:molecular chaperone DnaK